MPDGSVHGPLYLYVIYSWHVLGARLGPILGAHSKALGHYVQKPRHSPYPPKLGMWPDDGGPHTGPAILAVLMGLKVLFNGKGAVTVLTLRYHTPSTIFTIHHPL